MKAATKYKSNKTKFLIAKLEYSHRTSGPSGFDDSNVNYVLAKQYAKEAASSEPKNTEAMVLYGILCQKEKTNKYGTIKRDFKEASDLGDDDAMAYLGSYYEGGYGVVKIDKKLAVRYYRHSSKSGNLHGCFVWKPID